MLCVYYDYEQQLFEKNMYRQCPGYFVIQKYRGSNFFWVVFINGNCYHDNDFFQLPKIMQVRVQKQNHNIKQQLYLSETYKDKLLMLVPEVHVSMEMKKSQACTLWLSLQIRAQINVAGSDVNCGNQSEHIMHHAPLPH